MQSAQLQQKNKWRPLTGWKKHFLGERISYLMKKQSRKTEQSMGKGTQNFWMSNYTYRRQEIIPVEKHWKSSRKELQASAAIKFLWWFFKSFLKLPIMYFNRKNDKWIINNNLQVLWGVKSDIWRWWWLNGQKTGGSENKRKNVGKLHQACTQTLLQCEEKEKLLYC